MINPGNVILTQPPQPLGMVSNRVAHAQLPIERRALGRARTDCPVRLQTPGGTWHGRLWDLSEAGAGLQVENPPAQGAIALISWQANELFCRIVWVADDKCGVLFEKPIPSSVVLETLGGPEAEAEMVPGPTASVHNIPIGRRRSRLRVADDG